MHCLLIIFTLMQLTHGFTRRTLANKRLAKNIPRRYFLIPNMYNSTFVTYTVQSNMYCSIYTKICTVYVYDYRIRLKYNIFKFTTNALRTILIYFLRGYSAMYITYILSILTCTLNMYTYQSCKNIIIFNSSLIIFLNVFVCLKNVVLV